MYFGLVPEEYKKQKVNSQLVQETPKQRKDKHEPITVDVSKLSDGKVFKNYKDLATTMGWEVYKSTSNSAIAQFKALSSVCEWHKDVDENGKKLSNKIIIEKVYQKTKHIPDKRKTTDKSYLTRLVSRRILDIIDENQKLHNAEYHGFQNSLYLTMGSLYAQIGLVNDAYMDGLKNQKKLSDELNCPVEHVNDFYNCVSVNLKKTVDTALRRLHGQRLVYSTYTKRLILKDDEDEVMIEAHSDGEELSGEMVLDEMYATERQRKFIFNCAHSVLSRFGLNSIGDLYMRDSHFRRHFFEAVVQTVNERAKRDPFDYELYVLRRLSQYYNVLELSYSDEAIHYEINRLGEMSEEERELLQEFVDFDALEEYLTPYHEETKSMINQEHLSRLTQNAKQRHQKALKTSSDRGERYQRTSADYSTNMDRIAEKVIEQKND